MKKMISVLLAGLFVTAFAQASDAYISGNKICERYQPDNTSGKVMEKCADKKEYARNYQGSWNDNWSHPEWGYYSEVWGTASTLDVLADSSSLYKTRSTFKY